MAKMENPELEVVRFENEDVIATSAIYLNGTSWTYIGGGKVPDGTQVNDNGHTGTVNDNYSYRQGYYYIDANGVYHWHVGQ